MKMKFALRAAQVHVDRMPCAAIEMELDPASVCRSTLEIPTRVVARSACLTRIVPRIGLVSNSDARIPAQELVVKMPTVKWLIICRNVLASPDMWVTHTAYVIDCQNVSSNQVHPISPY